LPYRKPKLAVLNFSERKEDRFFLERKGERGFGLLVLRVERRFEGESRGIYGDESGES